ncbi:Protein NRT1/ PTR FAMILY 1.1 [Linum grandiflorum]
MGEMAGINIAADESQSTKSDHPPPHSTTRKGGLKTMPFIISNETLEKVAGVGLHANMTFYLKREYHMSNSTSANVLFLWGALSNFTPIFGAFASDSYLGRFRIIALGTLITLFGMATLWATAIFTAAQPPPCRLNGGPSKYCQPADGGQLTLLFTSFVLMAIGAGGIRPCSLAFGADQLNNPSSPNNERTLQTFFSWYYASVGISIIISALLIVAIQDKFGWVIGFGVPVVLMFISAVLFLCGYKLYIRVPGDSSLLSSFGQVVAAAWNRRGESLQSRDSVRWFYHRGSKLVRPTDKLRFLNKACMITNPTDDIDSSTGLPKDSYTLCSVQQVEEFKSLLKVIPIWSTTIIIAVTISQQTFPALQASTMDRSFVSPNIKMPAASYGVFGIITLTVWVALYDRILVPTLAKFFNRPNGISNKHRMGIGLAISCVATTVAGLVEHRRRNLAFREGVADDQTAVVGMSANWLIFQYGLSGLGEAFNMIGQIEFYYSQFPRNMRSIAMALVSLGLGMGNLVGSLIVTVVNNVSSRGGKISWVGNNLNKGHYDYYYWLLSALSVANFFYYLVCSWAYGNDDRKIWDVAEAEIDDKDEREMKEY